MTSIDQLPRLAFVDICEAVGRVVDATDDVNAGHGDPLAVEASKDGLRRLCGRYDVTFYDAMRAFS